MIIITSNDLESFIHDFQQSGFTAGAFGEACNLISLMLKDKEVSIFLSLSGALIPAGQQHFLVNLVKTKKLSGIVVTGATLTHDYLEDLGFHHFPIDNTKNDSELRNEGVNRIFDRGTTDEGFEYMEQDLHAFLEKTYSDPAKKPKTIVTPDFLKLLGLKCGPDSLLGASARANVSLYCPALTDSMLGVHLMTFREFNTYLTLDPLAELKMILSQLFSTKKTAAIILGGGVPKNYLLQGMLVSGKELDYAIQITMDHPEHGGLSGAPLQEAISWGKIKPDAHYVTVIADVTLVLPFLTAWFQYQSSKI